MYWGSFSEVAWPYLGQCKMTKMHFVTFAHHNKAENWAFCSLNTPDNDKAIIVSAILKMGDIRLCAMDHIMRHYKQQHELLILMDLNKVSLPDQHGSWASPMTNVHFTVNWLSFIALFGWWRTASVSTIPFHMVRQHWDAMDWVISYAVSCEASFSKYLHFDFISAIQKKLCQSCLTWNWCQIKGVPGWPIEQTWAWCLGMLICNGSES